MIFGQQDLFFLATWWVGYFFTAVQEFFSITFVLHAIFFFRKAQALAGNFFSKSPIPPPQELNCRPLTRRYCNAPALMYFLRLQSLPPSQPSLLNTFSQLPSSVVHISFILDTGDEISPGVVCMSSLALFSVAVIRVFEV